MTITEANISQPLYTADKTLMDNQHGYEQGIKEAIYMLVILFNITTLRISYTVSNSFNGFYLHNVPTVF